MGQAGLFNDLFSGIKQLEEFRVLMGGGGGMTTFSKTVIFCFVHIAMKHL